MADSQKLNTSERLASYGIFSDDTIKLVATFAKKQASFETYQDFLQFVGVPEPKLHSMNKKTAVPYIDIPAKAKKPKGVIVFHLPMANPLDPNQLYQVATIAGVNKDYRVIAFGNPSGKPFAFKGQNLSLKRRSSVAFTNDLKPLVEAELDYLQQQGINHCYQVGYSFGAHKALIESLYMEPGTVDGIVVIEPVAHKRPPFQLLRDFQRTLEPLGRYVDRTELKTFIEARTDSARLLAFGLGMSRPINLSIGWMLARVDFIGLVKKVLQQQPQAKLTVSWASKSELGNDAHLSTVFKSKELQNTAVRTVRLQGDTHAVANDVHLTAAIIREALQA